MPEENDRRKVLEEAIRFETDGREFFLKAAEKAKTYFAKVIFQIIAEEELHHIQKVKQIHESYIIHSAAPSSAFEDWVKKHGSGSTSEKQEIPPLTTMKSNLQNVFQQAKEQMDQKTVMNADEIEAIRLAIQLEIKGHEFYTRLAEEATSNFERAFYQHLAQEESVHFSFLRQIEDAVVNQTGFG